MEGGSGPPTVLAGRDGAEVSRRTQLCYANFFGGVVADGRAGDNGAENIGGISNLPTGEFLLEPDGAAQNTRKC